MSAPETGREIPEDVRAVVRNLRLMPDKARLAGAFEADCCSAADLIEAQAARLASLEALLHDIASDCRSPTAHAGNALRQIGDKIERAVEGVSAGVASLEAERAKTVEECARIADDHARAWGSAMSTPAIVIADAIRALASEKGGPA